MIEAYPAIGWFESDDIPIRELMWLLERAAKRHSADRGTPQIG